MQHPRPHLLRQKAREERRHRAARTAQRGNRRQTTHLQPLRDQLGKHGRGARVDRAEQEPDDGHGDGFADDVGDEPDEQLEASGAEDQEEDGALLADLVGRVGEQEAAEGDAAPETGGDVTDVGWGGVPVGDQEGDDPARDTDFGPLVTEDEESAQDGGLVGESGLEEFGPGRRGVWIRDCRAKEVDRWCVFLVVTERKKCQGEVD